MCNVVFSLDYETGPLYLNILRCVGNNSSGGSSKPPKPWSRVASRNPRAAAAAPPASVTVIPSVCMDRICTSPISYTHLRAHETRHDLVCRLLLEKKKKKKN